MTCVFDQELILYGESGRLSLLGLKKVKRNVGFQYNEVFKLGQQN